MDDVSITQEQKATNECVEINTLQDRAAQSGLCPQEEFYLEFHIFLFEL